MKRIPSLLILAAALMMICNYSCKKCEDCTDCIDCITCEDGEQNGDETGIDCGGSCIPCSEFCGDGKQSGDETGIDCGGSCCPCPIEIEWSSYVEMPEPRAFMASVMIGDKLYVSGGIRKTSENPEDLYTTLDVFDFSNPGWTTLAELNVPRGLHSMEVIENAIYIFGGISTSGPPITIIERYILGEDHCDIFGQWSEPRIWFGSWVHEGKIYVAGGQKIVTGNEDDFFNNIEVYNPHSNSWNPVFSALLPGIRSKVNAEMWNGKIYAITAWDAYAGGQSPILEIDQDLSYPGWIQKGFLNDRRTIFSTSLLNDMIFCFGGIPSNQGSLSNFSLESVEAYAPPHDCVIEATPMQEGRNGLISCVYNGDLYVFGGFPIGDMGVQALNTVERGVVKWPE